MWSTKFMHEHKCDLCNTRIYGFSPLSAAEFLEERHPRANWSKSREDLQLTAADEEFLASMRIGW